MVSTELVILTEFIIFSEFIIFTNSFLIRKVKMTRKIVLILTFFGADFNAFQGERIHTFVSFFTIIRNYILKEEEDFSILLMCFVCFLNII